MKSRPLVVAVTAAFLILAAWLAWRSGPVSGPAPVPPPTHTQTGEVIPSGLQPAGATDPAAPVAHARRHRGRRRGAGPRRGVRRGARNGVVAASATPTAPTGTTAREGAMVEVGKVRRMIVDYHTLMGENPVGTNAEIHAGAHGP